MVIKNYGISFGQNIPALNFISGCLWLVLIWWALREKKLSLWLVVLGGGMNWWERIYFGYISDYWKIPLIPLYNNFNDWLIFIGFGWYLIDKWKKTR